MANRFWVGGGSANTWAATGNTNWATTSGGANNASVPGASDVAIFDSNSGSSNSVIGASTAVQGLDCTGGTGNYAGTLTHNTAVTLTINTGAASSVRFSAGMTYTVGGNGSIVTFTHTSGTATVTSAGQRFGSMTINGAGGTTTLADALRVDAVANSTLTVTSGIFDAGTNTAAVTVCLFVLTGSTTRSVILGGLVKVGGNVGSGNTIWNATNTTNLTFTKNSANIEVVALNNPNAVIFQGGALTYNTLTLDATSGGQLTIGSGNTFSNLAVGAGWTLLLGVVTTTISNAFALVGTQARPIAIVGTGGGVGTISVASGACTLTWGALSAITATGGATFTATNTLDCGVNTGWTISPPADATTVAPTVAQIATAVWQDISAADFTVANSIGKSVMNGVALGTGLTINGYTGNTPQTGDAYARLGAPVGASTSADIAATKALLPTALVGGKMDSHVNDIAAGAITATSIAADAITDAKVASDVTIASVTGAVGSVTGAVGSVTGAVGSVTGNVGGNVTGTVASVVGAVGSVTGNVGGIAGTTQTLDALQTAQNSAHGAGSWATATGFATPTNITAASGVALTSAYDAAKTAASQSSVNAIPTTPLLAADYTAPDNATIANNNAGISAIYNIAADGTSGNAAIKTLIDTILAEIGTPDDWGSGATLFGNLYDANAWINVIMAAILDAGYGNAALKTLIDALPAATRDVSNASPAAGSFGEAARNADAKAASIEITLGTPANATVSGDLADILAAANAIGERTQNLPDTPAATDTVMQANIVKVNGDDVTGDGSDATPWGPA